MNKIVTVLGTRPQFIKASAVSRVIRSDFVSQIEEVLVHTGQHYDENMSNVFFDELGLPSPAYNLEISQENHGAMTGRMLEGIEKVLLKEKPDWVLIYGDTNSTLAAALAAAKLHIRVAHVEAGLRSFNNLMPEEINRKIVDHISTLLFCPTQTAENNLSSEGILHGVYNVGDVMYDVAKHFHGEAAKNVDILKRLGLTDNQFALATCHRAENTDNRDKLARIFEALGKISKEIPVVLPLHPRTKKMIEDYRLETVLKSLVSIGPVSYLEMIALENASRFILTDSGGLQKEAFFFGIPCITLREETEWKETVDHGMNVLCGADTGKIVLESQKLLNSSPSAEEAPYGNGDSATKILKFLMTN